MGTGALQSIPLPAHISLRFYPLILDSRPYALPTIAYGHGSPLGRAPAGAPCSSSDTDSPRGWYRDRPKPVLSYRDQDAQTPGRPVLAHIEKNPCQTSGEPFRSAGNNSGALANRPLSLGNNSRAQGNYLISPGNHSGARGTGPYTRGTIPEPGEPSLIPGEESQVADERFQAALEAFPPVSESRIVVGPGMIVTTSSMPVVDGLIENVGGTR